MKPLPIILIILSIVLIAVLMIAPDSQLPGRGKAAIGGPFTLVNHTGKTMTEKDIAGKYPLVFFGFTHCPDICPTDLFVISQALELLEDESNKIAPLFITIDPERDTPDILADYLSNFHPAMIGLTGTDEQIATVAKAYKVYYTKEENPDSGLDYTMNHSAFTYLMSPDGEYLIHFSHDTKPAVMAEKILTYLR